MDILETASTFILTAGAAFYLAACILAFVGLLKHAGADDTYTPSVSIIIAARNEEENIGNVLNDLLVQDYPQEKISIIVVDDLSGDGTSLVVRSFAEKDPRIRLLSAGRPELPYSHKKRAIYTGILAGDGEIIMTVDADCRVKSGWVRGMVSRLTPRVELAAGEILIESDCLMGHLEALEFTGIQAMSAGLMNAGFPVTCNGANLAYRRGAFERVGGYDGVGHVVSGDDDLLMQKIARGNPSAVVYVTDPDTVVRVRGKRRIREFLAQRIRWASKTTTYPSRKAVALLSAFFVFFTALLLCVPGALFGVCGVRVLAAAYGMKSLGDLLLCGFGLVPQRRLWLLMLFPLAEVLHVPYIIYVTLRGIFGTFEWHGRRSGAALKRR